MKDLIEIVLKNLVGYVPVLAAVTTSPKRSISRLLENKKNQLNNAMLFVGITIALGFMFQAPLLKAEHDFLKIAGSLLAFKVFVILSSAGVILFIFRRLGGKGDYETTLCTCLYVISPLYLMLIVLTLMLYGLMSAYDPNMAIAFYAGEEIPAEQWNKFAEDAPFAAMTLIVVGLLLIVWPTVWYAICWGAFRTIHQVSKIRSIFAFCISAVIIYIIGALGLYSIRGLYGGGLPPIM